MTKTLYFIIGDPIAQARSPEVFNWRFAESGIDAEMLPLSTPPSGLAAVLAGLGATQNCPGVIITIPHKVAAVEFAARRSIRVEIAGAANVLRKTTDGWDADLFDGEGFVAGLGWRGHTVAGKRAAVGGAGGAGLAVSAALLAANAAQVLLDDIDGERAEAAVSRLRSAYGGRVRRGRPDGGVDLAVNATPLGMRPTDALPFDVAVLGDEALVARRHEAADDPAPARGGEARSQNSERRRHARRAGGLELAFS